MSSRRESSTFWQDQVLNLVVTILTFALGLLTMKCIHTVGVQTLQNAATASQPAR